MRHIPILSALLLGAATQVAAGEAPAARPKPAAHAETAHATPVVAHGVTPAGLKWAADPDMPGVMMAVVYGDPEQGAFGAFEKWPAGTQQALHHHTPDIHGVGLSGTLVITMEDGKVVELVANGYAGVPSMAKHTTECKAGADCVFFVAMTGKADAVFAERARTASAPAKK